MRDESVMGKSTCCLMLGSNCRQITRHIASGVVLGNGDVVRSANSSAPLQVRLGFVTMLFLRNLLGEFLCICIRCNAEVTSYKVTVPCSVLASNTSYQCQLFRFGSLCVLSQASRCYKYMVKTLQNNAASCPNNNIVCLGRNMNEASQCTTYAAFIAERNG